MNIGIISGHLIPGLIRRPELVTVETPYGPVVLRIAKAKGHTLFFVNRHGEEACLPPHRVNARATISALAESHVEAIFSVGTVGSLKKSLAPGDFVVPHDFIDMTKSRPSTFFDESRVHVDMTDPFCPALRACLLKVAKAQPQARVHGRGVLVVTEGPRLETPAEIRMFASFADIVGMTLVPEVVLAREKGICFAAVCLVCNMAAGLQHRLAAEEIVEIYSQREPVLTKWLAGALEALPSVLSCPCPRSLAQARL